MRPPWTQSKRTSESGRPTNSTNFSDMDGSKASLSDIKMLLSMNVHPLNMENLIRIESYRYGSKAMNPWTHEPMNPRGIFVTSFRRLSASLRLASTNLGRHGNNELGLSENGVYSIEHGILMRSSVHLHFQFLWWKIVFFWPTRGLVFWIRASAAKIHLHTHCLGGGVVNTVKTHGKTSQRMADGPMANL